MRALLFILGIIGGSVGAGYAFPTVGTRLGLSLGDADFLPLAPIRAAVAPAAAPEAEAARLTLKSATGKVLRLTVDGEWTPFALNEAIGDGEQVRTEPDSTAVLSTGSGEEINLSEVSHLAVRKATKTSLDLRQFGGLVTIRNAPMTFHFESRSGHSVVEGRGGAGVLVDGDRIWASCSDGTLSIASSGGNRPVPLGSVATLRDGMTPAIVAKDDKLEVTARPVGVGGPNGRIATISGSLAGAGRVLVSGTPAAVDEHGAFKAQVHLHPGTNDLVVVAQNVSGVEKRLNLPAVEVAGAPKNGAAPPHHPPKPKGEGVQWGP